MSFNDCNIFFEALGLILYFTEGQIDFTLKYGGKTVTGLVGSSVNFTWSFSGDVENVKQGIKKAGLSSLEDNGVLVSLKKTGPVSLPVPAAYIGRVNGSGNVSSGHVVFTLRSIRTSDERFYGCNIVPTDSFDQEKFDSVFLAVKGESNNIFVYLLEVNFSIIS